MDEFRALDLVRLKRFMAGSALVDLRNIYEQDVVEQAGLSYRGVARGVTPYPASCTKA